MVTIACEENDSVELIRRHNDHKRRKHGTTKKRTPSYTTRKTKSEGLSVPTQIDF